MLQEYNYRAFIESQKGDYTLVKKDQNHYELQTDWAVGYVTFYPMEDTGEIIEFKIQEAGSDENKFFLHFQAVDPEHAESLFGEMVQTLASLKDNTAKEVLLCCSAGLTTSFFAEKLNRTAKMIGCDYTFSAVSASEVYEAGIGKAAVLVAPQIGYMLAKIKDALSDTPVLAIPTALFASYDAAGTISYVREQIESYRPEKETEEKKEHSFSDRKILAISLAIVSGQGRIYYRVYDKGKILVDDTVIKRVLTIRDIDDVIHTQLKDADGVSIAIPGILSPNGLDHPPTAHINLQNGRRNYFDIEGYYKKTCPVPVAIINNTRAAAVGWHTLHPQYRNIIFYSQPRGWRRGGQSMIINGRVYDGLNNAAGETKFIVGRFSYRNPIAFNPYNPDDVFEEVMHVLVSDIALIDPEAIVLRGELLKDTGRFRQELSEEFPGRKLPDLYHIRDYNEVMMLGQLVTADERLQNTK